MTSCNPNRINDQSYGEFLKSSKINELDQKGRDMKFRKLGRMNDLTDAPYNRLPGSQIKSGNYAKAE